jgi:hypothetical protein
MKLVKIALVTGALALVAGPAALASGKPEGSPPYGKAAGHAKAPEYTPAQPTPGPKNGLPSQAKAYGRYCKGESKEHVAGEKGTAFSRCVTAMAKAAKHNHMPPGQVCKGKSHKHVKGEKGTEFSRCVKSVAQMRKDEEKEAP